MLLGERKLYAFGPFRLDSEQRVLLRDSELIPLPPKALDTLLTLVQSEGRVLDKDELLKIIWPDSFVEEGSLAQNISILRKVLGEGEGQQYIQTIPKRGYRFVASVAIENGVAKETEKNDPARCVPELLHESKVGAAGRPARIRWATRPWLVGVGMLIVIGAVAVAWKPYSLRQRAPLDLSTYRYRPFAYAHGNESRGAWSPDGKSIAYKDGGLGPEDQPARLMLQPYDEGAATLLVDGVDGWTDVAWSPDGSRIYFKKMNSVYSVSPAGGPPQFVVKASIASSFGVSPDGKSLAIWRGVAGSNGVLRGSVWISSPPGAEPHEYIPAPFAGSPLAVCLRFSPNGKLIYLSIVTARGNGGETWLLPFPAGSAPPQRVFRSAPFDSSPVWAAWMPDSRRLILSASNGLNSGLGLWLADTRDESFVKLTDGSASEDYPAVSPDGQRLLYTRTERDADIVELPLDGSPPRKLLATDTVEYSPAWSPKGGEFAYQTERSGKDEIWLRSWPGDFERRIVATKEFPGVTLLGTPVFSPDGSRIAYAIIENEPKQAHYGGLYVSPRAGGKPVWLIDRAAKPSWSPDGAYLAFAWEGRVNSPSTLVTLRVGPNQQPFVIPDVLCDPPLPVWSPSGEWIACETAAGSVLASPDGKRKRTLPHMNSRTLAWSKDSATLYGLHNESGKWSLIAQDVRSGAVRMVADYGSELTPYARLNFWNLGLSLSPDGKSFAVGTLKNKADLWILEGFPQEREQRRLSQR